MLNSTSVDNTNDCILKADSGASDHYIKSDHMTYLKKVTNLHNTTTPINLPNNTILHPSHKGELPFAPQLSNESKIAKIVPGLTNASLFSIGKACDDGCIAMFSKQLFTLFKNNKPIVHGHRNLNNGLWDIPFFNNHPLRNNIKNESMNVIISTTKSKTALAQYLHTCAFSPTLSTFQKAIKTATSSHGQI